MAAPRPPRSQTPAKLLGWLRKQLAKGWPPGLTVLAGDDHYHMDAAQRELLAHLVPEDSSGFGLTVFGDAKVDVAQVISAARSAGMFASRRVVLVKDAGVLEGEPEAVIGYGSAPPPESFLVVRAPSLDKRRKLHKALDKSGLTLKFELPDLSRNIEQLLSKVMAMAGEKQLKLERSAAAMLLQAHGGELNRIERELEKLREWTGKGGEPVSAATIRKVGSATAVMSGWEVANAVTERDRNRALEEARRLSDQGEEAIKIIGGLAYRARVMIQAKALLEAGNDKAQVYRSLRTYYWQQELDTAMANYTLQELLAFPSILLRADRTLKSRAIDPGAVLESLVDDLTHRRPSVDRRT
jgi:DNA polymerase-3 subunit delta